MKFAPKIALQKYFLSGWLIFLLVLSANIVSPVQSHSLDAALETATVEAALSFPQRASFQDSCRNLSVNGNNLSARCRTKQGRYRQTSVEIRGITNVNGNLEYLREGRGRSTFQDTCTELNIDGGNLSAQCRREDGSYNYTTIFLRDIVNNDGNLQYGGDYPEDPADDAATDFLNSCRNIRVNSTTLTAQCRSSNDKRWRNTSIEIRGITNVDGNLEYLRDGRGRSTYQDTCTNVRFNQSALTARCQREDGSYNRTSISLTGIVNENGRLRYQF